MGWRRGGRDLPLRDLLRFLKQLLRFVISREPHQQIGIFLTAVDACERRELAISLDGRTMVWFRLVESAYTDQSPSHARVALRQRVAVLLVGGELRGQLNEDGM